MTKKLRIILALAVPLGVLGAYQLVFAEPVGLPEWMTAKIRQNCSQIKVQLKQIKVNDALARVNYGQSFESISQNVMIPVNNRLVASNYKPIELLEINNQYDRAMANFRQNYVAYEEKMSELLSVNCQKDPEIFYEKLVIVRSLRQKIAVYSQELFKAAENYGVKFKEMINEIQDLN